LSAAEFFLNLKDKPVTVHVTTGKAFAGTLIGCDTYDIIIRQTTGLEMLIPKGNVVYVCAAPSGAQGTR
jgi:sRNA-binding regulator protein Hfq